MKQIAMLDDSRTILAGLQIALKEVERSGLCKFNFFNDPIEFCEMIRHDKTDFDLFFLDLNMPGMSGLEVTKAIRSTKRYEKTPIYALTTEDDQQLQEMGIIAGMDGWIVKSSTAGMIREQIRNILNKLLVIQVK